jgi:hypothetical protein
MFGLKVGPFNAAHEDEYYGGNNKLNSSTES